MNPAARSVSEPAIAGGVSKQPAQIRLPGQVADAKNFDFPLSKGGATKRMGTWLFGIPMLAPVSLDQPVGDRDDGRMIPFTAGSDPYLLIIGNGTLQIKEAYAVSRNPLGFKDIEVTQTAWDYLTYQGEGVTSALTADNIRAVSVGDDLLLINTLRPTEAGETNSYIVSRIFDTTLSMYQYPPGDDGDYYQVLADDSYQQFALPNGDSTFAKVVCPTPNAEWLTVNGQWDDNESGGRRAGFKVLCQRKTLSLTGLSASATVGDVDISEGGAGQFDDISVGDMIRIENNNLTAMTDGWAIVKSISGSSPSRTINIGDYAYQQANGIAAAAERRTGYGPAVVNPSASPSGTLDITAVGSLFQASLPGYGDASSSDTIPTTIQGIAQDLMQNASGTGFGAPASGTRNLLSKGGAAGDGVRVWWDSVNQKFTVVSPYAGTGSAIIGLYPPEDGNAATTPNTVTTQGTLSPTGSGTTGLPFDGFVSNGATYTDGSGTADDTAQEFADQFTQVAPPGSVSGDIESSTMPMRVRRTQVGDAIQKSKFKIEECEWDARVTGNEDNNPLVGILENQSPIADAAFHRNRLWLVGGPFVAASAAGDPFRFFAEDGANPADDDPIGTRMGDNDGVDFWAITPFRQTLVLFSRSGDQFELNSPSGALTASTISITQTTSFDTVEVPPVASGNSLWFLTREGTNGDVQLRQYQYAESYAAADAEDVSAHVEGFLPENARSLCVVPNEGLVLILEDDDAAATVGSRNVFAYRNYWRGGQQIQSAWTKYTTSRYIVDAVTLDGEVYLLTCRNDGGQTLIEVWPQREEADVYPALVIPPDGVPNEAVTDDVTFTAGALLADRPAPTQFTVGDYGFTEDATATIRVTINSSYAASLDSPDPDFSGEEPFVGPYEFTLEYLSHSTSGTVTTMAFGVRTAYAYDNDGDGATDVSPSSGSMRDKALFSVTDRTRTTYYFYPRLLFKYDSASGNYTIELETPFQHTNFDDVSLPTFTGSVSGMEVWLGHDGSVGSAFTFGGTVVPTGEPQNAGLSITHTEDHPTDVTSYTASTGSWANSTVEVTIDT